MADPVLVKAGGKRAHWHFDYLREAGVWQGAWVRASAQPLECVWAGLLLQQPGALNVAQGFGASDCKCPTHLVHLPALPPDAWFSQTLGAERYPMGEEALYRLLDGLASGDESSREESVYALSELGQDAIEPLSLLLASESADTRWWAARALAELGGEEALEPLVRALTDPDPDVRACAGLALGQLGDGRAAGPLASRLEDDSSFVAGIAADALCMLGEAAVPALTEALTESSVQVRVHGVRALHHIGSESAIGLLIGLLEDRSYLVRFYAREALEDLGVGMTYFAP